MSNTTHDERSKLAAAARKKADKPPYGQQPQPQRQSENTEYDASDAEAPIDDPGDAQRSSKSEPDGDGEEELR